MALVESRQARLNSRPLDAGRVFVIDDLFDDAAVRLLHEYCRRLPFSRLEYANSRGEGQPQFNATFTDEALSGNPLLRGLYRAVEKQVSALFPEKAWRLDRVHCNAQTCGEIQVPHPDLAGGITALYYVNAEWQSDWQGETVFHDANGEPAVVVAVRPGRLVVFEADVVHRGGVPSLACREMRLSIAFKFAPPD